MPFSMPACGSSASTSRRGGTLADVGPDMVGRRRVPARQLARDLPRSRTAGRPPGRRTGRPRIGARLDLVTQAPPPGLCGVCRHSRVIQTARGSTFRLCERSTTDPRFPRYPNLPVLRVRGLRARRARAPTRRRALDARVGACHPPATSRRTGCERDEYPSSVGRETRWLVETGATTTGNGPGSLRTEREGRIGHQPVGSGAERQRYRAAPIGRDSPRAVGHASAASPNEGGTAEGTTFRPGTIRSFLILEATR